MKYLLKVALLAVVICSVVFQISISEPKSQTITAEDIYESIIYEDYVVQGVIESINMKWILHEEYNPYITHPALLGKKTQIVEINFNIDKVLIGALDKKKITLVGKNQTAGGMTSFLLELKEGDRMIIPIKYLNKGEYKSGNKYLLVGWNSSRFLITENYFKRGLKSDPIQTGKMEDLYKAIEEIKEKRSITDIAQEAELIARGTVINKRTTNDTLQSGTSKEIVKIQLDDFECLKGKLNGDMLEFSIIYMSRYNPPWKMRVPLHINSGEDWLVFLKWAEEPGYYPFAGLNGMFKIEDNKLIRDNRIVIKKDLKEVKSIIMEAKAGSDKDE
ncbi:MAG: hypothetical protein GF417_12350 [Candidatus Latescibacteria bacterium]|nr:hypothetical protein [Candidatus Latescibacterota bacterium]